RLDLLNRQRFIAQSEQRANPAPVTADAVAVLAADRGLPVDASEAVAREHASWGLSDVHGTTWITWAELLAADWQETDISGKRTREQAAGDASHWGPAWSVMRTLSDLHGAANVRLIVWFS
ncbi:hypothetical protein ABZS99_48665, partial [Streptomyces sp. NPDC005463]